MPMLRQISITINCDEHDQVAIVSTIIISCLQAGTNSTMEIPLPLLIVQASNDGVESSLSFTPQRYHPLTHPPSHHLTHTTNSCPYEAVILEAPVCGKITRTRRYVSRVGALQWSIDAWLPLANCSAMSDSLPSEVFLGQSESYYFKVHFVMSSTFPGEMFVIAIYT